MRSPRTVRAVHRVAAHVPKCVPHRSFVLERRFTSSAANDVADQLAQSQKLLAEAEKPVDERAAKADEIKQLLAKQLEDMGVTLQTSGKGTVGTARAGGDYGADGRHRVKRQHSATSP